MVKGTQWWSAPEVIGVGPLPAREAVAPPPLGGARGVPVLLRGVTACEARPSTTDKCPPAGETRPPEADTPSAAAHIIQKLTSLYRIIRYSNFSPPTIGGEHQGGERVPL